MPDFGVNAGDTNLTIYVRLRDSTTGLAQTGLLFNSAGAVCSYVLPAAARVGITLVTQTVAGAHTDGGFVEVDATNAKGLYRLDLTDAAVASGSFTLISIEFNGVIEETILIPLGPRDANLTEMGGVAQSATDLKDFADAGYDPVTKKVQGVVLVDTTTVNSDMVGTNSAALASVATEARLAELDAANLPADLDAVLVDTGTTLETHLTDIKGATFVAGTDSLESVRDRGDAAWTTGSGTGLTSLATGTAQGGAAASVTLAVGASSINSYYDFARVIITGGKGVGQSRFITSYTGSSKIAFVNRSWVLRNPGGR